jgi:hypothetical protein
MSPGAARLIPRVHLSLSFGVNAHSRIS